MSRVVVLDSSVLGLLVRGRRSTEALACQVWFAGLIRATVRVVVPEIADYELRRELLRLRRVGAVNRLDFLCTNHNYVRLDTPTMRLAADWWAFARQTGQPTAGDNTIDADMILIAQTEMLREPDAIIATTNLRHLQRFTTADRWRNIHP